MRRAKAKELSTEDRILWSHVARSARPLPGKTVPEETQSSLKADVPQPPAPPSAASPKQSLPPVASSHRHPRRLDTPTRERLARGRLDITGRVDLHGLTQAEAHRLLLGFLRQAFAADRRYVLVITGKGKSIPEGVLRGAVPRWFSTPPFAEIVSGFEEAARHHGGGGALYVRLRRRENRR